MANVEKYTRTQFYALLRHNGRTNNHYSNQEIDTSKTHLNYSIPIDHKGLSQTEYYQKVLDESYLYGRGTCREKQAITAASWIITLPKELLGNQRKEYAFFHAVTSFLLERYTYLISADVHYDEAGLPHIHVLFLPVTNLDHEKVHYKTQKTKEPVRLKSGRYEYGYRFKLDQEGKKIPLANYAKISDFYDQKLDASSVLNRAELSHFHADLQDYLTKKGIEGKVLTGTTDGMNVSVKKLKELTAHTGYTLDQIKETMPQRTLLESYVEKDAKVKSLEQSLLEKNQTIDVLQNKITELQEGIQKHDFDCSQSTWDSSTEWGNSGCSSDTSKHNTIHFEEE